MSKNNDSISRQEAIIAVSNACGEWRGIFCDCKDALEALPSAEASFNDLVDYCKKRRLVVITVEIFEELIRR